MFWIRFSRGLVMGRMINFLLQVETIIVLYMLGVIVGLLRLNGFLDVHPFVTFIPFIPLYAYIIKDTIFIFAKMRKES